VRIASSDFEIAYQIFEILNNRGLPLSNKDLFKNFIISELHQAGVAEPEQPYRSGYSRNNVCRRRKTRTCQSFS
jgi:hypothetical protein